ncbi:unnamed protein product [Lepeophtheirus salmonis]|uniref:(salmon louse) hypothetical protein n=1 Tax=Lepeophtheirus salmonis TaxID=72036 RepID=A0A817FA95_LEPSM|nr:unnamed protein product [Lepeophtheirus salmonis]CAG9476377.1 unnamed protein product [Lepeophtheirus salmonis]
MLSLVLEKILRKLPEEMIIYWNLGNELSIFEGMMEAVDNKIIVIAARKNILHVSHQGISKRIEKTVGSFGLQSWYIRRRNYFVEGESSLLIWRIYLNSFLEKLKLTSTKNNLFV